MRKRVNDSSGDNTNKHKEKTGSQIELKKRNRYIYRVISMRIKSNVTSVGVASEVFTLDQ